MNRKRQKSSGRVVMTYLLSILLLFQTNITFAANGAVSGNEVTGKAIPTVSENQFPESEEMESEETIEAAVSGQGQSEIQAGAATGPENPVHRCNKENGDLDDTDFDFIYFGSYPQSEVTDGATRAAIDKAIPVCGIEIEAGIEDVWVNGSKYRRISEYEADYEEYEDDVANNGYLYFKWERIKWKVLENNGNTLFVVADTAIDCGYSSRNQWGESPKRNWLNDYFYNAAFNSQEQSAIVAKTVVNEDNPEYGTAGGKDTEDNVYLLSIGEVTNEAYGFCSDYKINSKTRRIDASDYSKARGVDRYWWLRSPGCGEPSHSAAYVERFDGDVRLEGNLWLISAPGICPALHINLSSAHWFMTNDGTSGMGGDEKTAVPTASLSSGSKVVKNTKLALSCGTKEADIYYTTDGTMPTTASIRYTGEITIDRNMTIKAVAVCRGYRISDVLETSIKIYEIKVQKLSIQAPSRKLAAGKKVKLTLKLTPENVTNNAVKWETSNGKYAVVDKNGTITLKKAGIGKQVTVIAAAQDGSAKKARIKIKIMQHAVKSIKLKASGRTLKTGKTMIIKAIVDTTGKNANKSLKWSSSNNNYATVNSKGKVTAKKAGKGKTVTITAKSTDGSNKKAQVKIKIK